MNIAILGGGVEGQAVKAYFSKNGDHTQIFDSFSDADLANFRLEDYDLVFRSPSVHPQYLLAEKTSVTWTSSTKYFFDHCPAPIIGVTGTKGKGTTCSMIQAILEKVIVASDWKSRKVHLVGNIGNPAISVLDEIDPDDIVVYEMSSFQLWDLEQSPHIAVVLRIEPDHLDRHPNFEDYVAAKTNIVKFQSPEDYCIYFKGSETSRAVAEHSAGQKIAYPPEVDLGELLNNLVLPGEHNRENAAAAITAVAAFFHQNVPDFVETERGNIAAALANFKGLPHRLEFVRELNNVKYYDDNYSSAFPAMDVAIAAFENNPTVLIAGGKDRHLDLSEMKIRIFSASNIKKVILIGETKEQLAAGEDENKYIFADNLETAVKKAREEAEKYGSSENPAVVLMSPGAASFDMFENFSDRGDKFQALVKGMV